MDADEDAVGGAMKIGLQMSVTERHGLGEGLHGVLRP
jgi:hypothetical protein